MVRDLDGTVTAQNAQMGLLITLAKPTRGRLQHMTVAELLSGDRPIAPPTFLPYIPAATHTVPMEQSTLFHAL